MNKDLILSKAILNSISSVILVLIQGVTYFFLYKFLLGKIGSSSLGLWSLVIATTSSANLANLGITNSMVPFLAEEHALGRSKNLYLIVSTGFLLMLGIIACVAILFKFFGIYLLGTVIPIEYTKIVQPLINVSSASLLVNALSSIYLSSLEGLHRLYIKNIINILSSCLLLVSMYFLIDQYGIMGTVYAQLIQGIFVLAASFYFLSRLLKPKYYSSLIFKFDKNIAKKLLRSGYKFQIISFTLLFFDPFTKYLLSKFGGLSLVAYYEMANKLVTQFRSIIVMAGQSLIPMITNFKTSGVEMSKIYSYSFKLVFGMAISLATFLVLSSGLISLIWIGHIEKVFVIFVIVLSVGWFVNIISSPLYFINIGLNKLNGNVYSHILLFFMNIGFGYFLGKYYGGLAVIIGVSMSLAISSFFLIWHSVKFLNISFANLFGITESILTLILLTVAIGLYSYLSTYTTATMFVLLLLGIFPPISIFFAYTMNNSVFKDLFLRVLKIKKNN